MFRQTIYVGCLVMGLMLVKKTLALAPKIEFLVYVTQIASKSRWRFTIQGHVVFGLFKS